MNNKARGEVGIFLLVLCLIMLSILFFVHLPRFMEARDNACMDKGFDKANHNGKLCISEDRVVEIYSDCIGFWNPRCNVILLHDSDRDIINYTYAKGDKAE